MPLRYLSREPREKNQRRWELNVEIIGIEIIIES